MEEVWLALVVGNTRLHWGYFRQDNLIRSWHTPHLNREEIDAAIASGSLFEVPLPSLWIASAVPAQTDLWCNQSVVAEVVTLKHVPLDDLYPTLGTDRAINLLGAGSILGWPVLVIDSGTALTFTAGNKGFFGGAILPGIRLQGKVLATGTASLVAAVDSSLTMFSTPAVTQCDSGLTLPERSMPERWAMDTGGAIASGIIYSAIATITDYLRDWWRTFPTGKAIITGGDGPVLHTLLQQRTPEIASRVLVDQNLMFWGMQAYRKGRILDA
ncbi:MAG: pantothenate kinase [Phormidesmis sp.]